MTQASEHEAAFRDKKVIVTGGAGFIGASLAQRLVACGAKVHIVDAFREGCGANEHNLAGFRERCQLLRCDIADEESMRPLLRGADFVFDLAGRVSHVDSMSAPQTDFYDNAVAHLSLLEWVRQECPEARFLYSGTRGQYGAIDRPGAVDEERVQAPIDVNGASKSAGEQMIFVYARAYGLAVTSLRLTNTFGPRHQMKNGRHGVLNWFLRQLMDGQTIRLFGGGDQVRDTSFVDDVVDAMCATMASEQTIGQVYNVGGEALSLKQYCQLAIEVYGSGQFEVVEFPDEAKRIDVGDYVADRSKLSTHTGWQPRTGIRAGLVRSFDYYREHRAHYW